MNVKPVLLLVLAALAIGGVYYWVTPEPTHGMGAVDSPSSGQVSNSEIAALREENQTLHATVEEMRAQIRDLESQRSKIKSGEAAPEKIVKEAEPAASAKSGAKDLAHFLEQYQGKIPLDLFKLMKELDPMELAQLDPEKLPELRAKYQALIQLHGKFPEQLEEIFSRLTMFGAATQLMEDPQFASMLFDSLKGWKSQDANSSLPNLYYAQLMLAKDPKAGSAAEPWLEEALRLDPRSFEAAKLLAKIYGDRGDRDMAFAVADRMYESLEKDATLPTPRQGSDLLKMSMELAKQAEKGGDSARQQKYLEKALDACDTAHCGDACHRNRVETKLGLLSLSQGNVENAAAHLKRSGEVRQCPHDTSFGLDMDLVQAMAKKNLKREEMKSYLAVCIKMAPSSSGEAKKLLEKISK